MLDRVFAAVGIGAARVDTLLETDSLRAGERLVGKVVVQGGKVDQAIDGLVLELSSEVIREIDDKKVRVPHAWARLGISEAMTVKAGETREVAFDFEVPLAAPLAVGRQQPKTWVATRADISMALDPRDQDPLRILPSALHEAVFEAMQALGFQLLDAPLEASRRNPQMGCVQEFEFRPQRGGRFAHLDEAEIAFLPSSQGVLDMLIQRDTKARGLGSLLSEMAGTDEQLHRLTLEGHESSRELEGHLAQLLS